MQMPFAPYSLLGASLKASHQTHSLSFYPGWNTLQPMFILKHLQQAASTIKPNNLSRLLTAFIDFRQAYDTIPRKALWSHSCVIRMPKSLLSALQSLYAGNQYLLQNEHKVARVQPTVGVPNGALCLHCSSPSTLMMLV